MRLSGALDLEAGVQPERGQVCQLCSMFPPDDGKLSFEEFQNYFADGVLSPRELQELFSGIDGHSTE